MEEPLTWEEILEEILILDTGWDGRTLHPGSRRQRRKEESALRLRRGDEKAPRKT